MKNLSKTNWKEISHDNFREVFKTLENVFIARDINFFLIGALARDIWSGIHGFTPPAATKDIDIAIYLYSEEDYHSVKKDLVQEHGFKDSSQNQFVLISPNGTQVDLSPFGAIANRDEIVEVNGVGFSTISVEGFQEVYKHGLETVVVEDSSFAICSIPGIVILKLIAWNDRPEKRHKDVLDIFHLIEVAFQIFQEQIFEKHSDILLQADKAINYDRAVGALILGIKINLIVKESQKLQNKIVEILDKEIENVENSRLIRLIAQQRNITLEAAAEPFKLLKDLLK